ncbi:MAG: serine hydrolase domain-containing protein [Massiliimalia sp.]
MEQGILTEFVENTRHMVLDNVQVWQHDQLIAEKNWEPEIRRNLYSASKSFTSAAVGLAVAEGLIGLDDLVLPYFEKQAPENPSPQLQKLRVRHLLTMSMGQPESYLMANGRTHLKEDWVTYVLSKPFRWEPGTRFLYSNAGPYLAGRLVEKKCGCNLVDYLMPRLFEPLDILLPTWERDPEGHVFGAGGLFLSISDFAKFGRLLAKGGRWNGRQILPQEWIQQISIPHIGTGDQDPMKEGYSLLFWMGPGRSFRADGKYGQYAIVFPEKDAVVVVNAYHRGDESILWHIWHEIYPKIPG